MTVHMPDDGPSQLLACTRCTPWDLRTPPIPQHEGRASDPVARATVYWDPVVRRLFVTPHTDDCPRVAGPRPAPTPAVLEVTGTIASLDFVGADTVLVLEQGDTAVRVTGSQADLDGLVADLDSLMLGAGE